MGAKRPDNTWHGIQLILGEIRDLKEEMRKDRAEAKKERERGERQAAEQRERWERLAAEQRERWGRLAAEDRKQAAEDRRQAAEDRRQAAEDRRQAAEDRNAIAETLVLLVENGREMVKIMKIQADLTAKLAAQAAENTKILRAIHKILLAGQNGKGGNGPLLKPKA